MTTVNDLVSGTINRIDGIPTNITGSPIMWEYINDARIDVQNITSASIPAGDVAETYQSILKNLGAAYTLSRMTGVGVDFDYSLSTFRVMKGHRDDPNTKQVQFLLDQVNASLKSIRKSIMFGATFQ